MSLPPPHRQAAIEHGEKVVRYLADDAAAGDTAVQQALDRIRHESTPTPPIALDVWGSSSSTLALVAP